MKLVRFNLNIKYVLGVQFYVPDTLSRAPVENLKEDIDILEDDLFI